MNARITAIVAATVITLITAGGALWWSSQPSYGDTVKACAQALKAQYEAHGHGKPEQCHGVKDDDYDTLVASAAMDSLGWTDEDGNFDENKMIDSVHNGQP
jgi:cytochrome c1